LQLAATHISFMVRQQIKEHVCGYSVLFFDVLKLTYIY
jgi:hypothetical protein